MKIFSYIVRCSSCNGETRNKKISEYELRFSSWDDELREGYLEDYWCHRCDKELMHLVTLTPIGCLRVK